MSAITPKATNHAKLPPLASRFVNVAALPWEKTRHPVVSTAADRLSPTSDTVPFPAPVSPIVRATRA